MPPRAVVVPRLSGRRSAPKVSIARIPYQNPTTIPPPVIPYIKPCTPPRFPRSRQILPQPIILSTRPLHNPVLPPPFIPNIKPCTPPRLVRRRQLHPQPVIVSTQSGVSNLNNPQKTTFVVPRLIVPRGARPTVAHSLYENVPVILPYPDPIVVPRLMARPGGRQYIGKTSKPIIVSTKPVVAQRLVGRSPVRKSSILSANYSIPRTSSSTGWLLLEDGYHILLESGSGILPETFSTQIWPGHVIVTPRLVRPVQTPRVIIHSASSGVVATSRSSPSIIVPRLVAKRRARYPLITSANYSVPGTNVAPSVNSELLLQDSFNLLLESGSGFLLESGKVQLRIPRHNPIVVSQASMIKSRAPRPIVSKTVIAPSGTPDPIGYGPYDIISASIAWLRTNATLVATFGDSHATNVDKFTSDTEARSIDPPYAVFSEPQEFESFESKDPTGQRSSVVEGQFTIEVFSTGKLTTRQYSKQIGDWLSDAPLVFQEGVLIYLKAVERQYPTLRTSGPGENIVMFKRAVDFEYKFEKYISGS